MKNKYLRLLLISCGIAITSGCQSFNAAVTPQAKTTVDDFDGSKIIHQDPVSSSSSLKEAWHTLGFEWSTKNPTKVFVTAGVQGTNNIFGLDFNVDGQMVAAETASLTTVYGPWSTRRFVISYEDFEKIAAASSVKMKVSGANSYGVSSFGTSTDALVGKKFPTFLEQVHALKPNGG